MLSAVIGARRRIWPGGCTGLQNRVAWLNVARMVRLHPFSAKSSLTSTRFMKRFAPTRVELERGGEKFFHSTLPMLQTLLAQIPISGPLYSDPSISEDEHRFSKEAVDRQQKSRVQ